MMLTMMCHHDLIDGHDVAASCRGIMPMDGGGGGGNGRRRGGGGRGGESSDIAVTALHGTRKEKGGASNL